MKKIISLILVFVFLFSLTACEGIGDGALFADPVITSEPSGAQTYIVLEDDLYIAIEGLNVNECSASKKVGGELKTYRFSVLQAEKLASVVSRFPFKGDAAEYDGTEQVYEIAFGNDVFKVYGNDSVSSSVVPGNSAEIEGIYTFISTVIAKQEMLEEGFSDSYRVRRADGTSSRTTFSWRDAEAKKTILRKFDGVVFDPKGEYEAPEVYYDLEFKRKNPDTGVTMILTYRVDTNDRVFAFFGKEYEYAEQVEYIGSMEGISDYMHDMFNPRDALKEETTETAEKNNYKSLHITVNNDKNYLSEDFPEVEVISLSRLSYQIFPRLWVLRFRCDTEEELARIMDELGKREDVEKVTKAPTVRID